MYQGSSLGFSGLARGSSRFTKKHDSDGTIAPDVQPFHEAPKTWDQIIYDQSPTEYTLAQARDARNKASLQISGNKNKSIKPKVTWVPLAPRPNNTASEEWLKEIKLSRKLRELFNDIQNNHVSVEISIGSNKYVLDLDELQLDSPEKLGQILHQFDNLRKPDDHISVQYFYSKRHQPLNPKKAKNVLDSMTLIDDVLKIVSDEEQIKLIQPPLSYSQLFWAFGSGQFDMLIGSDTNGQFLDFNAKQLSEESLGNNFLKDISSPLTLIVKKNTRNAQENLLTSFEKNNLNINLLMMATKLSSFAGDLNVYYSDTYSLMPAQLSPKFVNQLLDLPLTVSQQDENSQQISHVNHELVSSRPVVVDFGKSQFIIDLDKFLLNSPEDQQFFLSLIDHAFTDFLVHTPNALRVISMQTSDAQRRFVPLQISSGESSQFLSEIFSQLVNTKTSKKLTRKEIVDARTNQTNTTSTEEQQVSSVFNETVDTKVQNVTSHQEKASVDLHRSDIGVSNIDANQQNQTNTNQTNTTPTEEQHRVDNSLSPDEPADDTQSTSSTPDPVFNQNRFNFSSFFASLFSLLFRSGVITPEDQQNAPPENVPPKKCRQPKPMPLLDDAKDLNIAVNSLVRLRKNFGDIVKEISLLEFESDHHQQAKNKMVESLNNAMGTFWDKTPPSQDSYKIFNGACQKAMGDAEKQFAKHGGFSLWRDIIVPILNTLIKIVTLIGKWVHYLDKKYEPKYYENPLTQAQLLWQKEEPLKPNFRGRLEENLDHHQEQIDDLDDEAPSP